MLSFIKQVQAMLGSLDLHMWMAIGKEVTEDMRKHVLIQELLNPYVHPSFKGYGHFSQDKKVQIF